MTNSRQKNKAKAWIISIIAIIIILGMGVGCYFLMKGTETRESSNNETYSITALVCESYSPKDPFFSTDKATTNKHTLKVTFKNNKPDKMSYNYLGDFETSTLAESASSSFHAKYNIDMSNHGLDPESLTPTFTAIDKTTEINLYTNANDLNSTTAKFFFLSTEEQKNVKNKSEKTIQNIYENINFYCKSNE